SARILPIRPYIGEGDVVVAAVGSAMAAPVMPRRSRRVVIGIQLHLTIMCVAQPTARGSCATQPLLGQVAQHVLQDAAVEEILELVDGIDAAAREEGLA